MIVVVRGRRRVVTRPENPQAVTTRDVLSLSVGIIVACGLVAIPASLLYPPLGTLVFFAGLLFAGLVFLGVMLDRRRPPVIRARLIEDDEPLNLP